MLTELFWIDGPWPGRLAMSARPRGGDWLDDETAAWREAGVDVVASLLTSDQVAELNLARERELCKAAGIRFYSLPIVDRSVPASDSEVGRFLGELHAELSLGKNVLVHCRQGLGRSALIAAGLLIEKGIRPDDAIRSLTAARHADVPETAEQRLWIENFAIGIGQRR